MNKPSVSGRVFLSWIRQRPKNSPVTFIRRWLAVVALGFFTASAFATDLKWDAGTANAGTGSGIWDNTTANWWNGSADVVWPQTSTTVATTGAVFGNGSDQPDGTYGINVDAQVAVTNIIFNNTGYNLTNSSGAGIYFNNASGGTVPGGVFVAAGKTADYNLPTAGQAGLQSGVCFGAGAGATLNLTGSALANNINAFMFGPGTIIITGATFSANQMVIHGPVVYNGSGTWTYNQNLLIAHNTGPSYFGTPATAPGSFTMNSGTFNDSGNKITIGRAGDTGSFILNGGTVNFWTSDNGNANSLIALPNNDNNATDHGTLIVNGGTFNIGGSSSATANRDDIQMMAGGGASGATAIIIQTGGVINDWGGIEIGNPTATSSYISSTAAITNSGGSLFIGANGITRGVSFPNTIYIQLSGGIVGALGNWSTVFPLDLDTANGNITFECDNGSGTPHSIGLSGALTGPGGFTKTGSGALNLSGVNNFAGSTVVSNGTLQIATSTLPTASGPNIVDGSAGGSPIESVLIQNTGQYWTNNGDLTYGTGTVTGDFNYNNGAVPSSTTAPIEVSGNLNFNGTPSFTVEGSLIPKGRYPLIQYGGTVNNPGNMPTIPTLPGSVSGYISNSATAKIIYLVVTNSIFNPPVVWSTNSGAWNFTSFNWRQSGSPVQYADGANVQFDDSWTNGSFSITVTNNGTVTPGAIKVSTTNAYTLAGSGTIAGTALLNMASSGTLTMAGTNTYSGGTLVAAGQLNINYGGDGSLNSAIGTGPLTNDFGSKIDNTSGHAVTLLTPIAQYWNDDWTFVGSTNYNTGPGAITLQSANVVLTVVSNTLEVDGAIGDNGGNFKVTKQGNGTLTLNNSGSSYSGGFALISGPLNVGGDGSFCGSGRFAIGGGSIDNVSGSDMAINAIGYDWTGNFSYLGTSNNLTFGSAAIQASIGLPIFVNVVSNKLITTGDIFVGNNVAHKTGQGTWDIGGFGSGGQKMDLSVDAGTVMLDKSSGEVVNNLGFVVQSNALAIITGSDGDQIADNLPVTLSAGGSLDLNGNDETVGELANNNGVLRNSLAGSAATLTVNDTVTLTGTSCVFDVPDSAASLTIIAITNLTGSGSLVKTGLGLLNLSTNSYTGDTTISNGTLVINFPTIANNSTVTVTTNAMLGANGLLTLNFPNGETNIVAALIVGGVSKPAGIYNNSTDPLYITGTGSIQVVPPITTNPLAGPIQFSVSGNTLTLGWPTNQGWVLQSQTNALSVGLVASTNAWFDVAGSASITNTSITITPTNPATFFRLHRPF
ncbi:MAG TPA: autotransporter-associated beta strand repeat-containing protein [Candidatus Acidoferrales bacterium]|jgi:fibronectin-binding autotransporter adhesin|nr:autotransporter-associated beta strand repeat-containing protein [Candidatus Acidoferrales bacterium]